jgi:dUTP pyrophosphatase
MGVLEVMISLLDEGLSGPRYANEGDAGCDLFAREGVLLEPRGGRALIPTGVVVALPEGYAGFIQPRSGLALHHGVTCLNSPGLIDAGYRGEIKVLLVNTDPATPFEIARGDRIAQLVIQQVTHAVFIVVSQDELPSSTRGNDGFGSSGR